MFNSFIEYPWRVNSAECRRRNLITTALPSGSSAISSFLHILLVQSLAPISALYSLVRSRTPDQQGVDQDDHRPGNAHELTKGYAYILRILSYTIPMHTASGRCIAYAHTEYL